MPRQSVFDMPFLKVYSCLVQKAERKGRTKEEVDQVTTWLTGYESTDVIGDKTYGEFLENAPSWNPGAILDNVYHCHYMKRITSERAYSLL